MPDFEKILKENINHSILLDKEGVLKAMIECYNLGVEVAKKECKDMLVKVHVKL
jgi:hypothetical protein